MHTHVKNIATILAMAFCFMDVARVYALKHNVRAEIERIVIEDRDNYRRFR